MEKRERESEGGRENGERAKKRSMMWKIDMENRERENERERGREREGR